MRLKVCTNCVLDSSEPNISFDDNGVCIYCNEYFELKKNKKNQLSDSEKLLKLQNDIIQIKKDGVGKEYDCIIGLSGGVDSSYVAYLVKKYGLRPLAIHLDNGWDAELAVKNIENLCNKLDIDLYTHVINWEEFRDLQLSFLKASVRNAEAPTDHAIFAVLYNLAFKYKIKWIIDGVNQATEYTRDGTAAGGYAYSDLKQILGIHKIFGNMRLHTYPKLSYYKKYFYKYFYKIRQYSILNYTEYNKNKALELLADELDWKSYGSKHHESIFTKWHQVVYLPTKFGFDKRKIHLSDLILSGQISRENALDELSRPPISNNDLLDLENYVSKKLGLDKNQYTSILNSQPKSHKDYPNDEWISILYKKYFKK